MPTFRVGQEFTWELLAADPDTTPPGQPPRFLDERHDRTEEYEVPHWGVTGIITRITGIRYPYLPVPGDPRSLVANHENAASESLDIVRAREDQPSEGFAGDEPEESGFDEFHIRLEVPDGTALPSYVLTEGTIALNSWEQGEQQQRLARMHDEVGVVLESLADAAEVRYAGVARFTRATDFSGVSIEPVRKGASSTHWSRRGADNFGSDDDLDGYDNDDGDDRITVFAGDGEWSWPATIQTVELLGEFMLATAEGRVYERVRPRARLKPKATRSLDTEVKLADGRTLTSSTEFRVFSGGGSSFAVVGGLWERVERGKYNYAPWDMPE